MIAWVSWQAERAMRQEATWAAPLETGGVLLGHWAVDSHDVVVKEIIGPGQLAKHHPVGFEPDTEYQEAEIARRYQASGRRLTYLGDWHAHPGGGDRLSRLDRDTLRAIARYPDARARFPLMIVIFGRERWTLRAWRWWPRRVTKLLALPRVIPLTVRYFDEDEIR